MGWYLLGLWWVWGHSGCCVELVWLRGWLQCGGMESDRMTEIREE